MRVKQELIYHITTKGDWEVARSAGYYAAVSLDAEGFIHCATAGQVEGVLKRYFEGKAGLVKLVINQLLLTSSCRFDISPLLNEAFPHIYGRLNLDAVSEVVYI